MKLKFPAVILVDDQGVEHELRVELDCIDRPLEQVLQCELMSWVAASANVEGGTLFYDGQPIGSSIDCVITLPT